MLSSNWRSISSIAGLILAAIAVGGLLHEYAQGKIVGCTQPYYAPGYSPDDPKPRLQSTSRSQTKPQSFQPLYKELDCQRPEGTKDYELCQQWRAANAGQEQACLAGLQFWIGTLAACVGALGLFGLLLTVIYTALSAKAASAAAEIAVSAIGTERAWMSFDEMMQIHSTDGRLGGVPFRRAIGFAAKWKNQGRSPALNTEIVADHAVIPWATQAPPPFVVTWAGTKPSFPIGPGAPPVSGAPRAIVDEQLDSFLRREVVVVLYSAVRYRDTFNAAAVHFSEICFRIAFDGERVNPDGTRSINFSIEAFGPQNTAT